MYLVKMFKKINITYEPSRFYKDVLLITMFLIIAQFFNLNLKFDNIFNYLWAIPIFLVIDVVYQYFTKKLKIDYIEE